MSFNTEAKENAAWLKQLIINYVNDSSENSLGEDGFMSI